jgi:oligogalacturonide transport system substrate-binding protein
MRWWGGDARHEAVLAALDIFMDRYPHITINPEYSAFAGFHDQLVLDLGARTTPDIVQVNYAWVHNFGLGQNVFLDLNTMSHILNLTEWNDSMRASMTTTDGQLAAVPHGMTGRVILYNRHMLEAHGRTTFPATIDELIEYGNEVAASNTTLDQGSNEYAFFPLGPETLDIALLTMLYNMTGKGLETNGTMNHTVEEVEAAFEVFGRMIDTNTIPSFQQQEPPADATNPVWMQGRSGSSFAWVSNVFLEADNFMEGDRDGLGVALFPAVTQGGSQTIMQRPSLGHTIASTTQHPELAAYILNFLYTDTEALEVLGNAFGIPLSRSAAAIAEANGATVGLQAIGLDMLLSAPAGDMGATFEDANMRNPRFAIIEAFRTGNMNARQAAEQFILQQQAALNDMR